MTELPSELSDLSLSKSDEEKIKSHINFDGPPMEAKNVVRNGKIEIFKSAILATIVLFVISLGYNIYLLGFCVLWGTILGSLSLVNTGVKKAKKFKYERSEYEDESLYRSVRDLSAKTNVKMPEIYPLDMPVPNAGAMHSFFSPPTLLISDKLVNKDEFILRAIVAHELGHIKSKSGRLHAYSAFFSIIPVVVPLILFTNIPSVLYSIAILCFTFILSILMKITESWIRKREEFFADRVAAETVGNIIHSTALLTVCPGNTFKKVDSISVKFYSLFYDHPLTHIRIKRLLQRSESTDDDEPEIEPLNEIEFGG